MARASVPITAFIEAALSYPDGPLRKHEIARTHTGRYPYELSLMSGSRPRVLALGGFAGARGG